MRPRVRGLLADYGSNATLITLASRRQTSRFLTQLRAETSARP